MATPLGLERRDALEQALAAAGVALGKARTPIDPFGAAATALYVRSDDDETLHRALAFERLWQARWAGVAGERWTLASDEAFARLVQVKREVRAGFPSWAARAVTPQRSWTLRVHAFHVPDAGRVEAEARLLAPYLAEGAVRLTPTVA
jgi:hypothetical protein